jgi:DNA-binding NtrC family response regulator
MTANATRILIVDDEDLLRWSLRRELERAGYLVDEASTAAAALEQASREPPDLVLLDYRLPDRTGFEVLRQLRKTLPRLPVVMLTAHASIDGAVEAMREGAYDYLIKPFEIEQVLLAVQRATEASHLREELALQRELGAREWGLQNLVAESRGMKEVVRLVQRVAKSEASTILLLGESGVGKGLVARALHFESDRREKPFLHITCTALPETLLESELFGHERGAFTDARRRVCSSSPTAAPCSWTRSATSRRRCRASCCASSRRRSSAASAARATSRSRCASSPRPTRTSRRRSRTGASAATCTSACG